MVFRILTIVSILGLLISCSKGSHSGEPFLADLKKKGELKIKLDSLTSFNGTTLKVVESKSGISIFYRDTNPLKYTHFDLSGKVLKRSFHPIKGPNVIPNPWEAIPIGFDSLLILGQFGNRIYLSNFEIDSLKAVNVIQPMYNGRLPLLLPKVPSGNEPIKKQNSLYVSYIPLFRAFKNYAEVMETPIFGRVDLLTERLHLVYDIKLPKAYYSRPMSSYTTLNTMLEKGDSIILGFQMATDIIIYSPSTGKKINQLEWSSIFDKGLDTSPMNIGADGSVYYSQTQLSYGPILWDEYRKVFYRQVWLPNPNFQLGNYFPDSSEDTRGFSIMIFDEHFKKLGEIPLPERMYNWRLWFVAPEGLYISTNNVHNPQMDEDILSFDIFELVMN